MSAPSPPSPRPVEKKTSETIFHDREMESGALHEGGVVRMDAIDSHNSDWLLNGTLMVVVVGASGDLAKKKTYPSLLNLYDDNMLPTHTLIVGYARSNMTNDELHDRLRPYLLENTSHSPEVVERFLKRCVYQGGAKTYGDVDAFTKVQKTMEECETKFHKDDTMVHNRLFYFAIPPNVFAETGLAIKKTCMQDPSKGWTRLIIEKPFGRDLASFEELNDTLSQHFEEDSHLFRIDHYLGKEMVQNLTVMRFSNPCWERLWNADHVQNVILTFKEPFGTEGRGGYFDKYGIIRDILQNHLLQVLTLVAMEPPSTLEGEGAGNAIRDAKVAVLNAMDVIQLDDVVLGQYEGYADDPTIDDKTTNTPTYATILLRINTPRWKGVPFIMKAGKALNERKAEVRMQFKDMENSKKLFPDSDIPRNEFVMRIQPNESVYMKTNVKTPGYNTKPIQSELEVNYESRFFQHQKDSNPDAYTRLILDVLQGKRASFVRDDELRRSWEIFTPLLHRIENEKVPPIIYKQGSRGPQESDDFINEKAGYVRNDDYVFYESNVARKTEGTDTKPGPHGPKEFYPKEELCDIGIFGLAVIGENFAMRMAEQGFKVCVGNRSRAKVDLTLKRAKADGDLPVVGAKDPEDLVAHLRKPRKVIIFVQAGMPVDHTISNLARHMEEGDLIIDGGDEWYKNSSRRAEFLKPKGVHFIGMGLSGGESGARYGPSLMLGGEEEAYKLVEPILTKSAASVDPTGPCVGLLGPLESGHYVKMVHNGIEYGELQLIAEVYDVLKNVLGMSNEEIADVFEEWQKGELASFLVESAATILRTKDDESGKDLLDVIDDKVGMKGTGMWSVQEAAEKGVAVSTMSAALEFRMLSGRKGERESASKLYGPLDSPVDTDKEKVVNELWASFYASKICSYAQALRLIRVASDENDWDVNLAEVTRLWCGGSVIRSKLVMDIHMTLSKEDCKRCEHLLLNEVFVKKVTELLPAWRSLVSLCVMSGIGCPGICGSLSYFDTYRRQRLPGNLIQAQRDFFGGHTYLRTDKKGRFHTAWTGDHKEIGEAQDRHYDYRADETLQHL